MGAVCWRSRCTGYRPILDAFKVFAKAEDGAYTEEAIAASLAPPGDTPASSRFSSGGAPNGTAPAQQNGNAPTNGLLKVSSLPPAFFNSVNNDKAALLHLR